MKNLLYVFALLFVFAACNNEDLSNPPIQIPDPQEDTTLMDRVRSQMDDTLNEYGDFDPETAPELFAEKRWLVIYDVECDSDWNITELFWCHDDSFVDMPGYEVFSIDIYGEDDPKKNWEYDASTQTIQMGSMWKFEYHILALGDEILMWEYSYLDTVGKKRFVRQIFTLEKNLSSSEE